MADYTDHQKSEDLTVPRGMGYAQGLQRSTGRFDPYIGGDDQRRPVGAARHGLRGVLVGARRLDHAPRLGADAAGHGGGGATGLERFLPGNGRAGETGDQDAAPSRGLRLATAPRPRQGPPIGHQIAKRQVAIKAAGRTIGESG